MRVDTLRNDCLQAVPQGIHTHVAKRRRRSDPHIERSFASREAGG